MDKFTFIDLFAGIGGMRMAFEKLGGKCVLSSEIDKYAIETYNKNFGDTPHGDITQISTDDIPDHDVLCAGFPCQAFSIAGKRLGFEDTRGTLFYEVARIIKDKQPKAFLLENVKGLVNHNKGKTLETILSVCENDLDYYVSWNIINAKDFYVPQNRERIIIVGFRKDVCDGGFKFPNPRKLKKVIKDVLETNVPIEYYITQRYLNTLKNHRARHENKGNGFGYQILDNEYISNAIVTGGMGRERNLIEDKQSLSVSELNSFNDQVSNNKRKNDEFLRCLTPRECARLQGFPDSFIIPVKKTHAYNQFGNSVAMPVIYSVGQRIIKKLGL